MAVSASLRNCTPSSKTGGVGSMKATILLDDATCAGLGTAQTLRGTGRISWKNGSRVAHPVPGEDDVLGHDSGNAHRFGDGRPVRREVGEDQGALHPVFTGTGPPCGPTNTLKKLTFTNRINSSTVVPFRIYAP